MIQRVSEASVSVAAEGYRAEIGKGLMVLAAFIDEDTEDDLLWTARKIAAAKTRDQLRMVISEIKNDMQEVKAGMEKGWCDESEMDKVNMLMSMAQNRMGEVEDREATPEEENLFAMASLM